MHCKDKYKDYIDKNPEALITKTLTESLWVCPDADIILDNDPFHATNMPGVNFVMVVNDCTVAETVDKEKIKASSMKPYAEGKKCYTEDEEERKKSITRLQINSMIIG